MIRRASIVAAALSALPAHAGDEAPPADPVSDESADESADPLARYRTQFDVLAERAIGTTSRPVEFNWRRTTAHLALSGSYLAELNNFNSLRGGGLLRLPTGGTIVEIGLAWTAVSDSYSSEQLAYTPYRQPGRPSRFELDLALGMPLAEGVVTTFPRFFPAVQMVFNVYGGLRYAIYPGGFAKLPAGEVASALLSPRLTEAEVENLDDKRLDAMQVDTGRYGLLVGFGNDFYFKSGFFLSPRLMVALPLLAPASQTELLVWTDLSLAIGLAL